MGIVSRIPPRGRRDHRIGSHDEAQMSQRSAASMWKCGLVVRSKGGQTFQTSAQEVPFLPSASVGAAVTPHTSSSELQQRQRQHNESKADNLTDKTYDHMQITLCRLIINIRAVLRHFLRFMHYTECILTCIAYLILSYAYHSLYTLIYF